MMFDILLSVWLWGVLFMVVFLGVTIANSKSYKQIVSDKEPVKLVLYTSLLIALSWLSIFILSEEVGEEFSECGENIASWFRRNCIFITGI